jgi:TonB family protein
VPVRIRDVRPRYPEGAGIEGIVMLNGLIGTDGFLRDLRVVGSAHPDLARAAIEAVSQWEFDETLLNCVPVETPMAVTVDFRRER